MQKVSDIGKAVAAKQHIIDVAMGRAKADLVLKNATYVNVFTQELSTADIVIAQGRIAGVGLTTYEAEEELDLSGRIVVPGLIDAHVHLESAMTMPSEFAKAVLPHGTTAVVTDPHEIVNVMGEDGFEFMMQATDGLPVDVFFGLSSCVPATSTEENGADVDYRHFARYYGNPRVVGLAEMMSYEDVCAGSPGVVERIAAAEAAGRVVDGHAPGVHGDKACAYVASGVRSDHECSTVDEALEKMRLGVNIMIREGTAAHNLAALMPLIRERFADRLMFCCDDMHPSDLLEIGHMDNIIRTAMDCGVPPIIAVKLATINTARFFNLADRGAIGPGYIADLVVVDDLATFNVVQVFKDGKAAHGAAGVAPFDEPAVDPALLAKAHDSVHLGRLTAEDFRNEGELAVLGMVRGELVSEDCGMAACIDLERDVLKAAVVERHRGTGHIGLGFIQNYGLKSGAVATSIAHDAHNVIVVGANEADMAAAVNAIADMKGGIVIVEDGEIKAKVPLPVAGLMSDAPLAQVNRDLEAAKAQATSMGVSDGVDPFMTLSFMSLSVIPLLRITTRGMFDVATQKYR